MNLSAETIDLIITIAKYAGSVLSGLLPVLVALIVAIKKKKKAKTEAAKAEATIEINAQMQALVKVAEEKYSEIDRALKNKGQSAGELKKDTVMSKLKDFCLERSYEFDSEKWSNAIEEFVSITKSVNAKK